jgi:hypothetical protein
VVVVLSHLEYDCFCIHLSCDGFEVFLVKF